MIHEWWTDICHQKFSAPIRSMWSQGFSQQKVILQRTALPSDLELKPRYCTGTGWHGLPGRSPDSIRAVAEPREKFSAMAPATRIYGQMVLGLKVGASQAEDQRKELVALEASGWCGWQRRQSSCGSFQVKLPSKHPDSACGGIILFEGGSLPEISPDIFKGRLLNVPMLHCFKERLKHVFCLVFHHIWSHHANCSG